MIENMNDEDMQNFLNMSNSMSGQNNNPFVANQTNNTVTSGIFF